jgi:hypothetical protein
LEYIIKSLGKNMSNKLDSMDAVGELTETDTTYNVSGKKWVYGLGWVRVLTDKLPNQDGYPHHVDFVKQHEHDQETMRLMSDEINRLRKIIANNGF